MGDQTKLPFVVANRDRKGCMPPLPLPPTKGMPHPINTYEDVDEPRFDPAIHLDLNMPKFIRTFPNFEIKKQIEESDAGNFAYSSPFQVLSPEGVRIILDIIRKYESETIEPKHARGNKLALRGLYYKSPFIRDFQNSPELIQAFRKVVGIDLIPHPMFSNVPHINLSVEETEKSDAPIDPWHWDSVAYTGVILLNDMTGFQGGELELMRMNKHVALKNLTSGDPVDSEVIGYESPGKMILAQGSEVLHHVTPLKSDHRRISVIMAYNPANCFEPTKSVLDTQRRVEQLHFMADYEYFREKTWQMAHILKYYSESITYEKDGMKLSGHLRVVAEELLRAADLLSDKTKDTINFFDEVNRKMQNDYTKCNQKSQ